MSIPDYQTLMMPVLQVAAKGETSVPIAEAAIAAQFALTDEEREQMLPSGKQRVLHNRLHWAKFYMTRAGLLESPKRGRFAITSAGQQVLAHPPAKLDTQFLLTIPEFREWHQASSSNNEGSSAAAETISLSSSTATPEEVVEEAHRAAQSALQAELLERVLQSSPAFFERVIVELLVAMGYGGTHRNAAKQLGKSGDGGVDGVINEDRLGLDRVYVQAKRYAATSTVGRPDVQAFTGSLVGLGASKGVFVTTSSFSAQADEFASRIPQRVILINGARLAALMIEHDVGVRPNRVIEFKRLDEDFFAEE